MESDLISRSEAIANLMKQPQLTKSVVRRVLAQTPSVDAVEVVRCRDCKHGIVFYDCTVECRFEEYDFAVIREDFDFCSYGERRGDIDGNNL